MTDKEIEERRKQYQVLKDYLAVKRALSLDSTDYLLQWQPRLKVDWNRPTFEQFLKMISGEIIVWYQK